MWANDADQDAFANFPGDEKLLGNLEQERPRDEQGRFVSQAEETPAEEAEPEAEEEPAAEEAPEEPAPAAPPDLEQRLADYERRLAEKEQFIQRQGNELGELRKAFDDRVAAPQVNDWQSLIDDNPAYAAQVAYERVKTSQGADQQARLVLQSAVQAWEEESRGAPALWAETVRQREEFEAKIAALEARVAPVAEETNQQAFAREYAKIEQKFPDLPDQASKMSEIVQRAGNEWLLRGLQEGTPEHQAQVLETLYARAKLETGDTLVTAAQNLDRKSAEDERRARDEATVVSASRSAAETTMSAADRMAAEWDELDGPLKQGWNI